MVSLVRQDIEAAASNYKHEIQVKILPQQFRGDKACCGRPRCCGVFHIFQSFCGAGLSIIDVPHVWKLGELIPCDTHSHVPRHVTKVLSSAFDADTIFYEVNVTSLTYTVAACASSEAATSLNVDGKAVPANYIGHSTAAAYQENRVLVSARDATTTTYVVHAFLQPVPCDCYAGTCNAFDGCVCDAE